jgi:hypothetical protein
VAYTRKGEEKSQSFERKKERKKERKMLFEHKNVSHALRQVQNPKSNASRDKGQCKVPHSPVAAFQHD